MAANLNTVAGGQSARNVLKLIRHELVATRGLLYSCLDNISQPQPDSSLIPYYCNKSLERLEKAIQFIDQTGGPEEPEK